jgi:hypothetical protein
MGQMRVKNGTRHEARGAVVRGGKGVNERESGRAI